MTIVTRANFFSDIYSHYLQKECKYKRDDADILAMDSNNLIGKKIANLKAPSKSSNSAKTTKRSQNNVPVSTSTQGNNNEKNTSTNQEESSNVQMVASQHVTDTTFYMSQQGRVCLLIKFINKFIIMLMKCKILCRMSLMMNLLILIGMRLHLNKLKSFLIRIIPILSMTARMRTATMRPIEYFLVYLQFTIYISPRQTFDLISSFFFSFIFVVFFLFFVEHISFWEVLKPR